MGEAIRINKSLAAAQGNYLSLLSIFSSSHHRFNDVCYATLMSRLGRLRRSDAAAARKDERYQAVLSALPAAVRKSGLQAMSNIAHALAKFGERGRRVDPILDAIEARADWIVREGTTRDVSNTAWAFAALGRDAPVLFSAIAARASWIVEASEHPQDVTNTAWAFATLDRDAPVLFSAIDASADWLVREGKPQEVANTAWAFWKLRRSAPALLAAINARSAWLVPRSSPEEVAVTALAFADLGGDAPVFWSSLDERAGAFVASANSQAVCTTAFALVIAGRAGERSSLLRALFERGVAEEGALSERGLFQLLQVSLHADSAAEASGALLPSPALMRRMVEAARAKENGGKRNARGSFADRVAGLLTDLGFEYEREFAFIKNLPNFLAIDFALSVNGEKTAVEVQGPQHFLRGLGGERSGAETGRTVAKRRLLERRGWKVVSLPW
ncbi:hypothetical protein TeGR_g11438 [Tetraparma gracilis]|uniref:RAP domain-containing protein n=1 Tax=Tetraparma gracilis TaxID=2962635 RepID=A0ABQ6MAM0_9STRA|nr:hypothetical protein TeGR_g11438 [Tetraparma gracilis]